MIDRYFRSPMAVLASLVLWLVPASFVGAHPGAINLYVDAATTPGRLGPLPTYQPGAFILYPGVEISSETPGITVTFPANGVAPQTQIEVEISQGLLYWNGNAIVPTEQKLRVVGPTFDSEGRTIHSAVEEYVVDANTRVLQGMTWGTYSGNPFWEADALYFLDDLSAPAGIYALVYRTYSPNYLASEPFLVPFVYDPQTHWSLAQRQAGIALLKTAVNPVSGDFDGNGAFDCLDVNALIAEIVAGNNHPGFDLTQDGLVDRFDLGHWLADAGSARNASHQPFKPGDANLDGVVDGSDFGAWNSHKFTANTSWCAGDFSADGIIDGSDFNLWNANKFSSSDGTLQLPEPGYLPWALMAWLLRRDRRRLLAEYLD